MVDDTTDIYWQLAGGVAIAAGAFGLCWWLIVLRPAARTRPLGWMQRSAVPSASIAVLMLGGAALLVPQLNNDGFAAMLPTSLITRLTPPLVPPTAEALRRTSVAPPDWTWVELRRRMENGALPDDQLALLVRERGVVYHRSRWPRGLPVHIWDGQDFPLYARMDVIPMPGDADANVVRLHIATTTLESSRRGEYASSFDMTLPIERVEGVDSVLRPHADAATTEAVRTALRVTVDGARADEDVPAWIALCVALDEQFDFCERKLAAGYRIEFLRDGAAVETFSFGRERGRYFEPQGRSCGGWGWRCEFRQIAAEELLADEALDHWTVRVAGDGAAALNDWGRDDYWAGAFTLSLRDVLSSTQPDSRSAVP